MKTITHDLRDTLEGKEVEIYRLLCENKTNQEIAAAIDMPIPTIKWHLRNIYRKLGVDRAGKLDGDAQLPRRRAILYAGTKIEQVVSYGTGADKTYTIREIRTAAKKNGLSLEQTNNLISFLEMD